MTIYNDIRACLDTRLSAGVGLPNVAKGNTKAKLDPTLPFLKTSFVPTLRRPATRGLNPSQRYDGIYNILVCVPEGKGEGVALNLVDNLLGLFNATTDIKHPNYPTNPLIISIDYSEPDRGFLDNPYYCLPINIAWYCYKT